MGSTPLVIVESPTKARTIKRFLSKDFNIQASNGHIRDLPNSAAEIPAKYKKEKWSKLGVNIDEDFSPLYVIPREKKEHVKNLKKALADASELYLATDEDREGESISWHLVEALKPNVPVKRLVFHEITKEAINAALENPREIDYHLVRAQEARRIVDRLFGYEVSPLLWKKMLPRLSAGRVQSLAVRLLVERERERIRFQQASFWGLKAKFEKRNSENGPSAFEAELVELDNKRIAVGRDFDPNTGALRSDSQAVILDEAGANSVKEKVLAGEPLVTLVEKKPFSHSPPAPFITSSLQQEANRKLRFSAKRTMNIAQKLYENGFITYMRTDSTILSDQALNAARTLISNDFGQEYLPPAAREYKSSVKNAQEAHEAIRPAGDRFTPPAVVQKDLGPEAAKLYELIWKRTVASQMTNAKGTYSNVHVTCDNARFRASGKTIEFPGFLRAYVEGSDDPEAELADREKILPKLSQDEPLNTVSLDILERSTQAPPRYTEGSLIKELERLGIGRPSTWATIVELVLNRAYAFKKGNVLIPTFVAIGLIGLLEKHFTTLLDYGFTARLEDDLDAISRGEAKTIDYLHSFYFGNGHPGLKSLVEEGESSIDPRVVCSIPLLPPDGDTVLEVRIGRYGPFLSNGEQRASVPEMTAPDELTVAVAQEMLEAAAKGPESLGAHPDTGQPVYLKNGPYGPYVQLGDADPDNGKPKMASLLSNITPEEIDLDYAVKLLSLPRSLGEHPEDSKTVTAANGRFGPYVKWGIETRSIPLDQYSPLDITLEQAIELLKQPKSGGRSNKPKPIREIGQHPVSELQLTLMTGRYGPYVTDGTLNASLPKGMEPEVLTVDDAVNLLEQRALRKESQPTRRRKSAPKKTKAKGKGAGAKKTKKTEKKDE